MWDLITLLTAFIFWRQPRMQSNLEYLEGESWFKQRYSRKLLNDVRFRSFIKRYNLEKVFQDTQQKDAFKDDLRKWATSHGYE